MDYDVIVLGAGAAGLMCAAEAARRGRRVLVVESNAAPGRKILISGGGRCNFTNLYARPECYISENPDFCRSALAGYTPADFIDLVESRGITYYEKKLGQLFCNGSARQILDLLEEECADAGVAIRTGCRVRRVAHGDGFELDSGEGRLTCRALVVATGGLSLPKLGAGDFGYRVARQFGLAIVEPRPGLVPLTFDTDLREFCASLGGSSLDVSASVDGAAFRENLLFTHHGISGPAVLQVSSYWRPGSDVVIDLLPGEAAAGVLLKHRGERRELASVLSESLPRRFAQAWCARYAPSQPLNRYSERRLQEIGASLNAWRLQPSGTRGFGFAEVTVGGVDTRELSSKTMESRRVPGLYFIGEVVDVTGWLGGYNFQWAWASAVAAGRSL